MTRLTAEALERRVIELEDEKHVRACMNRYMYLCDNLTVGFDLAPLAALFTEDAVWEGKGGRYAKTFGRRESRADIAAMFGKYTKAPAHFAMNVHFLTSELIELDGNEATGSWVLLQTSSFTSGKSQLSSARLTVRFRKVGPAEWQIAHFQTESLFNRPVDAPWDQPADLPIPDKA